MLIDATGIQAHVGELCELRTPGEPPLLAEVVGFQKQMAILTPLGPTTGISALTEVVPSGRGHVCPVGPGLLGRVLDALGEPMDGKGPLKALARLPVQRQPVNPLARRMVAQPLATGIAAIDGLLTLGEGQRVGVFSPPGVGKSTLLGMLARGSTADVNVVALIGERGREVKEFIEDILGDEGRKRSVVVAAPADAPPLMRMQGAHYATAIAEFFRDQGRHVLLLMDSLTRYAMAQREIALAIGEPPATKGYPPSCFAKLPQLVERSGNGLPGEGSITAFYTVLTEGDDPQDPIADSARGILDGHIVLSRELAEAGHYPAIDIERSISRVMTSVAPQNQVDSARRFRQLLAKYNKARDLIQLGAYAPGSDPELDTAVRLHADMTRLLQQDMHSPALLHASVSQLQAVVQGA
jgi:flagellum-specific ATP synthase